MSATAACANGGLRHGQLEAPRDLPVGGQAVLEGVMMRGVSTWAVAVRKPTPEQLEAGELDPKEGAKGEIEVVSEPLASVRQGAPLGARCRCSAAWWRWSSR